MSKQALMMGSDPEFMLQERNGNLKSAIGIVDGTKEHKVNLGNGHYMFFDNVLVEVNVVPASDPAQVVMNFQDCLKRLSKAVYPYTLRIQSSAKYPVAECQAEEAKVFGCEPEYDAYELSQVMAPTCTDTFRSAGGHIHLGYAKEAYPLLAPKTEDDRMDRDFGRVWVVRMMDLFVGIPSLFIDHDPTSAARRRLYGNAGTHRPKEDYGVEYRATSNFWLRSPKTVTLIYNLSQFVVDFVAARRHLEFWKDQPAWMKENEKWMETHDSELPVEKQCFGYNIADLKDAINNSNKDKASIFLSKFVKKHLPTNLYQELLIACEPSTQTFQREWGIG